MDALRADHLTGGSSATPALSPELEELVAEGFELRRHRSLAPSTLPSTRALLTGSLLPPAADAPPAHLAEAFRRAGYRTGLFSGNPFVSKELGLDRGFETAPEATHYDLHALRKALPYNDNAEVVHAAALDWLASLPGNSRVFLYLHTMHPHNPYAPPPEIHERLVGESPSRVDGASETLLAVRDGAIPVSDADRAKLAALYAGGLAYNGVELRAFLDRLEERFDRDDTLLVLTSDHGEELFDHGGVLHGYTLYEELLRIPLVVRWPGRVRPGSSERLSTTLDLRRTLLELAGVEDGARLDGVSLLPLLLRGEDDRSWDDRTLEAAAPDVRGGLFAVRQGPWKLVFAGASRTGWGMGQGIGRTWEAEYLFHLGRDPHERSNELGLGGLWEDWLRARIDLWAERLDASGTTEAEPSEELRRRLEALGYVE
jgi:arylsulfatase A-like enzyme